MRRKPIILFLLVLLLSIGGAVFYQKLLQHTQPDFREVDTFLRTTETGGWQITTHSDNPPHPASGWWSKLGTHRNIQQDQYIFTHERAQATMVVGIIRHDGKFSRIIFSGGPRGTQVEHYPEVELFRNATFEKFPQLRRYEE